VFTIVAEECTASIFRLESKPSKQAKKQAACLAYSSTVKMEASHSFIMSADYTEQYPETELFKFFTRASEIFPYSHEGESTLTIQ
jgi:hypothetical protein